MFRRKVKIFRIRKGKKEETEDIILYETPIDLYINSKPLVNIICLAKDLKELSIGFLFSIGIINSIEDVKIIKVNELENTIFVELDDNIDFNLEELDLNPVSRVIDTTCGIPSPWRNAIKETLEKSNTKEKIKSNKLLEALNTAYADAETAEERLLRTKSKKY